MFDFIEGEIMAKEQQRLVLKTGGVGFLLKASNQTMSALPAAGNTAMVFTNLQIREDDISLYGFASREERAFFDMLIQVTGVGPKLALAILSAYPALKVKQALIMGDLALLTSISGIGKKTAQRLILELKDKLDKERLFDEAGKGFGAMSGVGSAVSGASVGAGSEEVSQAVAALEALGYTRSEIITAFTGTDLNSLSVEAMIKLGLKKIARY